MGYSIPQVSPKHQDSPNTSANSDNNAISAGGAKTTQGGIMNTLILVTVVVAALMCVHAGRLPRENKYTTRYDNINLDDILKSDRLLNFYVDCLLGKEKRCSPDAKELKANLPDALHTDCSKCSEKQKEGSDKVIHFLIDNKPELWKQLEAEFDPQGEYKKKYNGRQHV
uniref:Uncharacterized protein n=1 Tax=Timema douglasi TaxID=61478 RepID=A0A7R8VSM7_TIMDO|nr:unnamed protein product [Timema douglasi]